MYDLGFTVSYKITMKEVFSKRKLWVISAVFIILGAVVLGTAVYFAWTDTIFCPHKTILNGWLTWGGAIICVLGIMSLPITVVKALGDKKESVRTTGLVISICWAIFMLLVTLFGVWLSEEYGKIQLISSPDEKYSVAVRHGNNIFGPSRTFYYFRNDNFTYEYEKAIQYESQLSWQSDRLEFIDIGKVIYTIEYSEMIKD